MRTLILVVLGGALLYFAWSEYGGVDAANDPEDVAATVPDEGTRGTGQLSSVAEMEARMLETRGGADAAAGSERGGRGGSGDSSDSQNPGSAEPYIESAQGVPDPGVEGVGDDEISLDLSGLGDPLHEGALLLHDHEGLQAYLDTAGAGLSKSRTKLLISYLLLIRGAHGQVPQYADGLSAAKDVTSEEYSLIQTALRSGEVHARNASRQLRRNPLVLGVSMALMVREAGEHLKAERSERAAQLLSEVLVAELEAPWEADLASMGAWSDMLEDAQARHRWDREGKWPAVEVTVQPGDTLVAIRKRLIAERPDMKICTGLIERTNQLGRYLREDQVLRVPTDRVHTLIDLSARWLLHMHGGEVVASWPVAIGREGSETTPGRYHVGNKTPEPTWFPVGRTPVPYGDAENPLGTRWIALEGSNGLGIHGTWEPGSLGSMASDGCLRLQNEKVEELFEVIPVGSEVIVRP